MSNDNNHENPKREYLGLNLGKIGDDLPKDFTFESKNTMNTILGVVEKDIINIMEGKKDVEKKKDKLKDKVKEVKNAMGDNKADKTDKTKWNDFYKNLSKVCISIPFDDEYDKKNSIKATDTNMNDMPHQIFNLVPKFTTKKGDKEKKKRAQYIIGRVASITKFSNYNLKFLKVLYLEGPKSFVWTPFVNDLFVTCSYAYAKFHQIKKYDTAESTNENNLVFPIMLVMEKGCVNVEKCNTEESNEEIPEDCMKFPDAFLNATTTTEKLKTRQSNYRDKNITAPESTCVFQPITDNSKEFPSVTFRELVILADILGMDVYQLITPDDFGLNTDQLYIYYFSIPLKDKEIENFQKSIKNFNDNNNNKEQGFSLKKIKIEWARTNRKQQSGGDYEKYLEYKQKYVVLKKISNVNK